MRLVQNDIVLQTCKEKKDDNVFVLGLISFFSAFVFFGANEKAIEVEINCFGSSSLVGSFSFLNSSFGITGVLFGLYTGSLAERSTPLMNQ